MNYNTNPWGGQPLKSYSIWEQREIISYSDITTSPNISLVNTIISNVVTNTAFTWTKLTVEDEALIQKRLREHNLIIKCFGLDQFPQTTVDLIKLLDTKPLASRIKDFYFIWIGKIIQFVMATHLTILVIFGLLYYQADLLLWAVLFAYIISNCASVIQHSQWAHRDIQPKNKIVEYVFDFIGALFGTTLLTSPRISWGVGHAYHHNEWGSDHDDIFESLKLNGPFKHLLFVKKYGPAQERATEYIESKIAKYISTLNPVANFIEKHFFFIALISHILLLLLLGIKLYFYFVVFQIWFHNIYQALFGQVIAHPTDGTPATEKDRPKLFLLNPEYSYHKSHHEDRALIVGPGMRKYFNIQYYFIRLFYSIVTTRIK